jgi:hypothetical protein
MKKKVVPRLDPQVGVVLESLHLPIGEGEIHLPVKFIRLRAKLPYQKVFDEIIYGVGARPANKDEAERLRCLSAIHMADLFSAAEKEIRESGQGLHARIDSLCLPCVEKVSRCKTIFELMLLAKGRGCCCGNSIETITVRGSDMPHPGYIFPAIMAG